MWGTEFEFPHFFALAQFWWHICWWKSGIQDVSRVVSTPFPSGSALNFNRIVVLVALSLLNSLRNSLLWESLTVIRCHGVTLLCYSSESLSSRGWTAVVPLWRYLYLQWKWGKNYFISAHVCYFPQFSLKVAAWLIARCWLQSASIIFDQPWRSS